MLTLLAIELYSSYIFYSPIEPPSPSETSLQFIHVPLMWNHECALFDVA